MFWMVRVMRGEIHWLDSGRMITCLYRAITCSCRDLFAGVIPSMSCDLVTGKRNITVSDTVRDQVSIALVQFFESQQYICDGPRWTSEARC